MMIETSTWLLELLKTCSLGQVILLWSGSQKRQEVTDVIFSEASGTATGPTWVALLKILVDCI